MMHEVWSEEEEKEKRGRGKGISLILFWERNFISFFTFFLKQHLMKKTSPRKLVFSNAEEGRKFVTFFLCYFLLHFPYHNKKKRNNKFQINFYIFPSSVIFINKFLF